MSTTLTASEVTEALVEIEGCPTIRESPLAASLAGLVKSPV
jgi:hypothetical protein